MSQRFYSEQAIEFQQPGPGRAWLEGAEARHLAQVMRLKTGECVVLFDGSGAEFNAEIEKIERNRVTLSVLSREQICREAPVELFVGVAMPKGDRQKALVEKLTELGVARLTPLRTERSVVDLKPSSLDKLRRLVIESSKQCGRNRLMEIASPQGLREYLSTTEADERLAAHPGAAPLGPARSTAKRIAMVIGPEGGFSEKEIGQVVELGWRTVSLGESLLRIETAAIALVATRAIAPQSE